MSSEEFMERARWATEEALIKGNIDALDEVFDPNATFNSTPLIDIRGLEKFKQAITGFRQACSTLQWNWDEEILEGNTGVHRYTVRAKHTGAFPKVPVPPTGKELVMKGCAFYHFKNGKIHEFIEYFDWLGLMQQLGAIPSQ